jgi:hypothetical protein
MEADQLLNKIEDLRLALCELAQKNFLTDPEVIELSQQLDQLLNEFQQL